MTIYARKLETIAKENPNAVNAGYSVGSVVGLIGGPALLAAKGGKATLKLAEYIARGRAKGVTRKQVDDVKSKLDKRLKKAEKDDPNLESDRNYGAFEAKGELKRFTDDWKSLERQKNFTPAVKQDAFRDMIRNLSDATPEMAAFKKGLNNPYATIFSRDPSKIGNVTGGTLKKALQEVGRQGAYKTKQFALNLSGPVLEGIAAFGFDFGSNVLYGYDNFREQGVEHKLAMEFALRYAVDRTPEEALAEIAKKIGGRIPGIGKAIGLGAETIKSIVRLDDVNLETGAIPTANYKALGGFIKRPKSIIARATDRAKVSNMVEANPMIGNSPMNKAIGTPDNTAITNSLIQRA